MDFTSPVIIATIIGLVFTQFIGRFVDHHYDKNYRVLERNLQIKKLLGDDVHNASLDELIRRQLNSYIVYEMGNVKEERKHKVYLFGIGVVVALAVAVTIFIFQNSHIMWGIVGSAVSIALGIFYYERKKIWFARIPAENTQYRANLSQGRYNGGSMMIDIMPTSASNSQSTLDHPFLYIEDVETERIYEYKRVHSTGEISISSGADTSLISEYVYQTFYDGEDGRKIAGKNPIVSSLIISVENHEPFDVSEAIIIGKPIKGAVSLVSRAIRVGKKIVKKSNRSTANISASRPITSSIPSVKTAGIPVVNDSQEP